MLSKLPPGELTVYLDRRYVPDGLLTGEQQRQALVRPRAGTPDVNFIFKRRPRAVEMKVFSSPPGLKD
jgi:lactam utilization protein B